MNVYQAAIIHVRNQLLADPKTSAEELSESKRLNDYVLLREAHETKKPPRCAHGAGQ
jgi:hypothetical protein